MKEFLALTLKVKGDSETNVRFYPPADKLEKAVILVGGIGGDFDTPAKSLYPKLAVKLASENTGALRVQFRYPTDLEESVRDVLAGVDFLVSKGMSRLGLVGHSFGGAVVIRAGAKSEVTRTVVTLATQGYGAQAVVDLPAYASILLIHGSVDQTLSPENSRTVYQIAQEPKKLVIFEGANHDLDQASEEVFKLVKCWLKKELSR